MFNIYSYEKQFKTTYESQQHKIKSLKNNIKKQTQQKIMCDNHKQRVDNFLLHMAYHPIEHQENKGKVINTRELYNYEMAKTTGKIPYFKFNSYRTEKERLALISKVQNENEYYKNLNNHSTSKEEYIFSSSKFAYKSRKIEEYNAISDIRKEYTEDPELNIKLNKHFKFVKKNPLFKISRNNKKSMYENIYKDDLTRHTEGNKPNKQLKSCIMGNSGMGIGTVGTSVGVYKNSNSNNSLNMQNNKQNNNNTNIQQKNKSNTNTTLNNINSQKFNIPKSSSSKNLDCRTHFKNCEKTHFKSVVNYALKEGEYHDEEVLFKKEKTQEKAKAKNQNQYNDADEYTSLSFANIFRSKKKPVSGLLNPNNPNTNKTNNNSKNPKSITYNPKYKQFFKDFFTPKEENHDIISLNPLLFTHHSKCNHLKIKEKFDRKNFKALKEIAFNKDYDINNGNNQFFCMDMNKQSGENGNSNSHKHSFKELNRYRQVIEDLNKKKNLKDEDYNVRIDNKVYDKRDFKKLSEAVLKKCKITSEKVKLYNDHNNRHYLSTN